MLRLMSARVTAKESETYSWPTKVPSGNPSSLARAEITFPSSGVWELPAQFSLRQLNGDDLYNHSLSLRHPYGIYNISAARVVSKIQRTSLSLKRTYEHLASYDPRTRKAYDVQEEFLDGYESLLYAFAEHVEDCCNIIRTFYSNRTSGDKNKRLFSNLIQKHVSNYLIIVNKIKHSHQRLQPVTALVRSANNTNLVHCYYVSSYDMPKGAESTSGGGVIQPDKIIHENATAISIHRDFCLLVFGFCYISSQISKWSATLSKSVDPRRTLNPTGFDPVEIIRNLEGIPSYVLPNELEMPFACLGVAAKTGSDKTFNATLLSSPPPAAEGRLIELIALYRSDGVSDTFRLPYWGPKWSGNIELRDLGFS